MEYMKEAQHFPPGHRDSGKERQDLAMALIAESEDRKNRVGNRLEEKMASEREPGADVKDEKAKLEEDIDYMLFRETPEE